MIKRLAPMLLLGIAALSAALAQPREAQPLRPGERLEGRFVEERHLTGLSAPLNSTGRFMLVPGTGLLWRSETPFDTVLVITPKGIVQMVNGSEAQRLPAARLPFLAGFYDMLSGALGGDWSAVARDFTMDRRAETGGWSLVLTPLHADDPAATQLQSITITGSDFVDAVEIHRPNGDWERLAFLDQKRSSAPLAPEDRRLFDTADP